MKQMLILAVTLWLGVAATAHAQVSTSVGTQPNPQVSAQTGAQVNSPTNAVSTVTGAIVPSGRGVTGATGGSFSTIAPVAVPCASGVSLSADLTAFGCASDPLGAPTYQVPAEAGATAVTTAPVGSIAPNTQSGTPNAASGAGGAVGGVASSSVRCLGAIPSMAGNASAGDLFGGIGGC
ncbi:hypothetical protein [Bradyrhizobium sp. Leo121]|uniref:hypothetical protein n=1 Tax=Bradyrhizobium sp. Leo121 TaxID=1571195 RepID=UPI001029E16D|nr:hypothetical protein [Bradyrhizobium sp. Leo121]